MKKRSYKLSLPRWALAQRESWYAELAARGLRVQKAGAMLTRFAPAPPARLRYRFEVGSDAGGLPAGQNVLDQLVTALKLIKSAFVLPAMILASVVFPTPGGPQKIMEEIWSRSMS